MKYQKNAEDMHNNITKQSSLIEYQKLNPCICVCTSKEAESEQSTINQVDSKWTVSQRLFGRELNVWHS